MNQQVLSTCVLAIAVSATKQNNKTENKSIDKCGQLLSRVTFLNATVVPTISATGGKISRENTRESRTKKNIILDLIFFRTSTVEAGCEKKCVKVDQRRWFFRLNLDENVKLGEENRGKIKLGDGKN